MLNMNFKYWKKDFGVSALQSLTHHGTKTIKRIVIFRRPLSIVTNNLFDFLSAGHFSKGLKSQTYDKLFHLGIYVILEDKTTLRIDKTEVVNIKVESINVEDERTEYMDLPFEKALTLFELIEKTKTYMGKERFFSYNGHTNNCQIFILSILDANNINNPTAKEFIYQNVDWLFKNHRYLRRLMSGITDTQGNFTRFFGGGSICNSVVIHTERTTNTELENIASKLGFSFKQLARDTEEFLTTRNDFYLVNLDLSTGPGTHWTALVIHDKKAIYIDSFGIYPPKDIEDKLFKLKLKSIHYNSTQYQDTTSNSCGLYFIASCHFLMHNNYSIKKFNQDFLKMFSTNLIHNEKVVKKYIETMLKQICV